MKAPIITADMLRAKGACRDQVELFERTFPNGAKITVANARKYGALFDVDWAARRFLRGPALEAYRAATRPALEAYRAATRPAWEAYQAVERPAWEAYQAVERPAWEAYEAATRTAREAYQAACAVAFARAYIQQEAGK